MMFKRVLDCTGWSDGCSPARTYPVTWKLLDGQIKHAPLVRKRKHERDQLLDVCTELGHTLALPGASPSLYEQLKYCEGIYIGTTPGV